MTCTVTSSGCIRHLNDAMRSAGPAGSGQWVLTAGVSQQGSDFIGMAIKAVQEFAWFTLDNDPYGEHDFGALNLAGETLLWKIDYYDERLEYGSDDPSDPARTRRVLTVMLASEY